MKPLRLYIENFYCHKQSFIDFTKFDSALVIAKINDNEDYSNGAGKTSIFKAIEYVLFNETPSKLETIIRDDSDYCKISFDFEYDNSIYRVSRTKTKKNNDLTFFQKIVNDDSFIYEEDQNGYHKATNALELKDHWKNLTSTRSGDTEKKLFEIIKTNYKFFCNTSHFMQNNISGLATTSPEKRRQMLKESLDLTIYSLLEKHAKNKFNSKSKELEKVNLLIDNIGTNLNEKISENKINLNKNLDKITTLNLEIENISTNEKNILDEISLNKENLINLKNLIENSISNKNKLNLEINDLNIKNKDLKIKLSSLKNDGEEIVKQIESINKLKEKLSILDVSVYETELISLQQLLSDHNSIVSSNMLKYDELSIPLPNEDQCKHCRQVMTKEHKEQCLRSLRDEIEKCKENIKNSKEQINKINLDITKVKNEISKSKLNNDKIIKLENDLKQKNESLKSKRDLYKEYNQFVKNNDDELNNKNKLLNEINLTIDQNSLNKIKELENLLSKLNNDLSEIINNKNNLLKQKSYSENAVAVLKHQISELENNNIKLDSLKIDKDKLQKELEQYPNVIQAFSNKGIPSLIIQNLLDELQDEANELLTQLKPGLQLQFVVTKEKSDDDTLDIIYSVNNRHRYYQQLSGAMQICVMFSLKLGWSFLLQKKFGFDTPLILLDEVDQSLDKAGISAFVDIVKFFQQRFKILIITHNDRLKGKIPNVICVNQDKDKISQAKLI